MTDEQRAKRLHYHMYESLEGIQEHAERIVRLEELALEVFECARRGACCEKCKENNDGYACVYIMRELGIEVPE